MEDPRYGPALSELMLKLDTAPHLESISFKWLDDFMSLHTVLRSLLGQKLSEASLTLRSKLKDIKVTIYSYSELASLKIFPNLATLRMHIDRNNSGNGVSIRPEHFSSQERSLT